jgi:hypothetical protein
LRPAAGVRIVLRMSDESLGISTAYFSRLLLVVRNAEQSERGARWGSFQ